MDIERSQSHGRAGVVSCVRRLYGFLAPRGYSVIMFAALFCTLVVKFFHSLRMGLVGEYFGWVLFDIAVLLGIEVVLFVVCFFRPAKLVIRIATVVAAVVCTWSVMNAGWLIRTGTQILPTVLLPLVRDPLNALVIIGVNFAQMPIATVVLMGPSAVALCFFFSVLGRPVLLNRDRRSFAIRIIISAFIIITVLATRVVVDGRGSVPIGSAGLSYNSQLRAVTIFLSPGAGRVAKVDFANAKREIPSFDQVEVALSPAVQQINHNVVIVVFEGVQYKYTSLADEQSGLTPYLASLGKEGVEFVNARCCLTHTTKVLFSLLTGMYPSVSQDLAEAVPVAKPYGSIVTILRERLNFRTAFFQSAKGNFECRPGLVYNMGFEKFWARDLGDPNTYVGYLGSDEFSMLEPISEWIRADEKPFLLIILCSVTHDPYEVPEWFGQAAKEPIERYRQSVLYTDRFISELNVVLTRLNVADKTIFCVIGDHGEAFGEHGLLGHERIAYDEVLRIPWVIRAPFLVEPGRRVTRPVSTIDLTPTLLSLLGFDIETAGFDGVDGLGSLTGERKVYFSGWLQQSPAGFVRENRKFIYNPSTGEVSVYDMRADPFELYRMELSGESGQKIADEIISWRKSSIFRLNQQQSGRKRLFDVWNCRWNNRVCSAKYRPNGGN